MPYEHPKSFSLSPYFDDYDENKQFLRTLFRPGHAVQGRELTQLQTILQQQVSRVGDHLFEDGSQVFGGHVTDQEVKFIRLNKSYASSSSLNPGQSIDASILIGGEIRVSSSSDIRANIVHAEDVAGTNDDYIVLFINYTGGDGEFTQGSTLQINQSGYSDWGIHVVHKNAAVPTDGDYVAAKGTARLISVDEGIFYVNSFFVKNLKQTIAIHRLSESNQTETWQFTETEDTGAPRGVRLFGKPSARVGLDVQGEIISSSDDSSLFDPASGTYNFNAPGADRYKINPTLTQIEFKPATETATDLSRDEFIELARIVEGNVNKLVKYTDYSVLEDTLARRTYDESGSYTVRPFELDVRNYLREDKHVLTGLLNTTNDGLYESSYSPFELLYDGVRVYQTFTGERLATFKVAYLEQDDDPILGANKFKLYLVLISGTPTTTGTFRFDTLAQPDDFPEIMFDKPIFDGNPTMSFSVDEDGAFDTAQVAGFANPDASLGLGLENGKAYIFGYEFETQGTKFVRYNKPRERDDYSGLMETDIGNFVYIRSEIFNDGENDIEVFGTNNFGEGTTVPHWPIHDAFNIGNINNQLPLEAEPFNLPEVWITGEYTTIEWPFRGMSAATGTLHYWAALPNEQYNSNNLACDTVNTLSYFRSIGFVEEPSPGLPAVNQFQSTLDPTKTIVGENSQASYIPECVNQDRRDGYNRNFRRIVKITFKYYDGLNYKIKATSDNTANNNLVSDQEATIRQIDHSGNVTAQGICRRYVPGANTAQDNVSDHTIYVEVLNGEFTHDGGVIYQDSYKIAHGSSILLCDELTNIQVLITEEDYDEDDPGLFVVDEVVIQNQIIGNNNIRTLLNLYGTEVDHPNGSVDMLCDVGEDPECEGEYFEYPFGTDFADEVDEAPEADDKWNVNEDGINIVTGEQRATGKIIAFEKAPNGKGLVYVQYDGSTPFIVSHGHNNLPSNTIKWDDINAGGALESAEGCTLYHVDSASTFGDSVVFRIVFREDLEQTDGGVNKHYEYDQTVTQWMWGYAGDHAEFVGYETDGKFGSGPRGIRGEGDTQLLGSPNVAGYAGAETAGPSIPTYAQVRMKVINWSPLTKTLIVECMSGVPILDRGTVYAEDPNSEGILASYGGKGIKSVSAENSGKFFHVGQEYTGENFHEGETVTQSTQGDSNVYVPGNDFAIGKTIRQEINPGEQRVDDPRGRVVSFIPGRNNGTTRMVVKNLPGLNEDGTPNIIRDFQEGNTFGRVVYDAALSAEDPGYSKGETNYRTENMTIEPTPMFKARVRQLTRDRVAEFPEGSPANGGRYKTHLFDVINNPTNVMDTPGGTVIKFDFAGARAICRYLLNSDGSPDTSTILGELELDTNSAIDKVDLQLPDKNALIFRVPVGTTVDNFQSISYAISQSYSLTGLAGGQPIVKSTGSQYLRFSGSTGGANMSPSDDELDFDYTLICTETGGSSNYTVGQIIDLKPSTQGPSGWKLRTNNNLPDQTGQLTITPPTNISSADSFTLIATLLSPLSSTNETIKRLKTRRVKSIEIDLTSNQQSWEYDTTAAEGGEIWVPGLPVFRTLIDTSDDSAYIGYSDIYDVVSVVWESEDGGVTKQTNITNKFKLDNGQRDNYYDYGRLILNSDELNVTGDGVDNPYEFTCPFFSGTGKLRVTFRYLEHSGMGPIFGGGGENGSYTWSGSNMDYGDIPIYTSRSSGQVYSLRGSIDFRPVRDPDAGSEGQGLRKLAWQNGTSVIPRYGASASGGETQTAYNYYLPRHDKLVLNKDREFRILYGVDSLNPVPPADDPEAMTLYTLKSPPFVFNPEDVEVEYVDNKRFTMRDIGDLESRIEALEYYSSLNLLEKEVHEKPIASWDGSDAIKSGVLVDQFKGHSTGDVLDTAYNCSIDISSGELRPSFDANNIDLELSTAPEYTATNIKIWNSNLITKELNSSQPSKTLLIQPLATKALEVNPSGFTRYEGTLKITPTSDFWWDKTRQPKVKVNLDGENDSWAAPDKKILTYDIDNNITGVKRKVGFGTQWNDWETIWCGEVPKRLKKKLQDKRRFLDPSKTKSSRANRVLRVGESSDSSEISREASLTSQRNTREGIKAQYIPERIQQKDKERKLDRSVIPYMRQRTISIVASGLKPNTTFNVFFDKVLVNEYCSNASGAISSSNKIKSDSNGRIDSAAQLKFVVPKSTFTVGDKLLRLIDNTSNDVSSASSTAEIVFASMGTKPLRESSVPVVSCRRPTRKRQSLNSEKIARDVFTRDRSLTKDINKNWVDPMAQTFSISKAEYPNGCFLHSVDLFFKSKDGSKPIKIDIRPTVNGRPHPSVVVPHSEVEMLSSEITTKTLPSFSSVGAHTGTEPTDGSTRFSFDAPVYLEAEEYCITVHTNSTQYEIWSAELGGNEVSTGKTITKQPYSGQFYKQQNTLKVDPEQNTKLMFRINRCNFNTAQASLYLTDSVTGTDPEGYEAGKKVKADTIRLVSDQHELPNTGIEYSIASQENADSVVPDIYSKITANVSIPLPATREIQPTSENETIRIKTTMQAGDSVLSPVIDYDRINLIAVENLIDGDSNDNTNGELDPIPPTVLGSASNRSDKERARYITRKIKLSPGVSANDLKVFLKTCAPSGSSIKVYAKLAGVDADSTFDSLPYTPLTPVTNNKRVPVANNSEEFTEVEFNYQLPYNQVSGEADYVGEYGPNDLVPAPLPDYNTLVIKICFFSTNSAVVPRVKDLRTVTLTGTGEVIANRSAGSTRNSGNGSSSGGSRNSGGY